MGLSDSSIYITMSSVKKNQNKQWMTMLKYIGRHYLFLLILAINSYLSLILYFLNGTYQLKSQEHCGHLWIWWSHRVFQFLRCFVPIERTLFMMHNESGHIEYFSSFWSIEEPKILFSSLTFFYLISSFLGFNLYF